MRVPAAQFTAARWLLLVPLVAVGGCTETGASISTPLDGFAAADLTARASTDMSETRDLSAVLPPDLAATVPDLAATVPDLTSAVPDLTVLAPPDLAQVVACTVDKDCGDAGVGSICCGRACVNPASDPKNCGACGQACTVGANATAACVSSMCRPSCVTGFADCDNVALNGCEVQTATDPANCGGCGRVCPTVANGAASCSGGACGIGSCMAGYADCDGKPATGCESRLAFDAANCGGCGKACQATPNTTAYCAQATCGVTCNAGFADCDGVAANGCEANLATDPKNCGACGKTCVCVAHCTVDSDCANSCPPTGGQGVNCCDAQSGTCFVSAQAMCPAPAPVDMGISPYGP